MPATSSNTPYWRLSGFYFFYFASLGAIVPYWNLYLKELNYTATQTGILIGILMATKVIAPNIWGWIADHTGKRMTIVRIGCLFAAITYAGNLIDTQFWWLVLIILIFSFFWNAALPQFEATTFNHLGDREHHYSSVRLWGSIGFVIAVVGLGYIFESISILELPVFVLALLFGIWLVSLAVPESASGHMPVSHEPLLNVLKKPAVAGLLVTCFCMQASHGPYYAIYSRYMESYGYSVSNIGWLWALGVGAEVLVFIYMFRVFKHISLRILLLVSLFLATVRWLLIALVPDVLSVMLFAQLLHAATFGVYHAAAIRLIHQMFTGRHQGKGQALYSSLSFGAGGAIGSLYSGFAWDNLGKTSVFFIALGFSILGFIIAYTYIKPERTRV